MAWESSRANMYTTRHMDMHDVLKPDVFSWLTCTKYMETLPVDRLQMLCVGILGSDFVSSAALMLLWHPIVLITAAFPPPCRWGWHFDWKWHDICEACLRVNECYWWWDKIKRQSRWRNWRSLPESQKYVSSYLSALSWLALLSPIIFALLGMRHINRLLSQEPFAKLFV